MERCELKPIWDKNLCALIVGQNPAPISCKNGVYFTSRTKFWELLHASNITKGDKPIAMKYQNKIVYADEEKKDKKLLDYGLGITDILHTAGKFEGKNFTKEEQERLDKEITDSNPHILAFVGKMAYRTFSKKRARHFGLQETCEGRLVFVLPFPTMGHLTDKEKIAIYNNLAQMIADSRGYRSVRIG